jgi:hypothetical protein
MYTNEHDGKHMMGDRMKILLLNLPFLFRDLVAPEVRHKIIPDIIADIIPDIVIIITDIITDIIPEIMSDISTNFLFLLCDCVTFLVV